MKIVVTGQPKTGTTAVFFALKAVLPEDCVLLFEPRDTFTQPLPQADNILAKTLLYPNWFNHEAFDGFDKKVLIIRDPRDAIISSLLWWVIVAPIWQDEQKVALFVQALQQKEADPSSVSFLNLIAQWDTAALEYQFLNLYAKQLAYSLEFRAARPDYFTIRYKDFIRGHVDNLEAYLGLQLPRDNPTNERAEWMTRTKASGNWRHWFLPEDVDFFRSFFREYMAVYEYGDDWTLVREQTILPEHGSQFVQGIVEYKRNRS